MRVVIVGGGPAGSVLALRLARAGIDVTLFDRATFPRPKPCGDCLSAEATRILDRLGLLPAVEAAGPARLAGWHIVAPRGHAFSMRFDELGVEDPRLDRALALPRIRFDAALLNSARCAGAEIRTGAVVRSLSAGTEPRLVVRDSAGTHDVRADLVVGADGLRSTVARRVGAVRRRARVRKVSLTAHVQGVALDDALGEMHVLPGLCAGLAPVGRGGFNLTLVADSDRFGRAIASDAGAFFSTALTRFPALGARIRDATIEGESLFAPSRTRGAHLLASGPFDVPVRTSSGPGWALVGDAAGYFDPFTGQGICHALQGADRLADAILGGVRDPARAAAGLRAYARVYHRMNRATHRFQHIVDAVLRHPALADHAIARLARAPLAARALLATTADVRPPSSLLSPFVLLSFALPRAGRFAA